MSGRLNRVRQAISSPTGTGGPLVLGSTAYSNAYLTIAGSGGVDQTEYCYIIEEGNDWEIQRGLWTSSSNQLARNTPIQSSIAGVAGTTKLTLAGTAFIRIIADSKELSSLVGVRTVTGTTDTINDSHSNVLTVYNRASAVAVSIAAPSGNSFKSGWIGYYKNIGAGAATITATGASIYSDGVSSSAFTLNQYESAIIFSDGTNYYAFITRQPTWSPSLSITRTQQIQMQTNFGFDTWRQNILLNAIYQSKTLTSYRRLTNVFADGYKASDGVNTGSSSNYSVDTSGGKVSPSLSTAADQLPTMTAATTSGVTVSAASTYSGSDAYKAADDNNSTFWSNNGDGFSNMWWKVDFGANKTIGSYTIRSRSDNNSFYPKTWKLQGSANDSTWTDLDSQTNQTFSSAGTQLSFSVASPAAYRYHRLLITAGNDASYVQIGEIELKDVATTNSMILVTTSQTADASVSNARVLLEFDNLASPTPNTDLTVEVTCNGGTNWTSASLLTSLATGQGGRKIIETSEVSCTPGTSFAARVKTFNSKNVPIYGLTISVC